MIQGGHFSALLSGFRCHVMRSHDWKRAVRNRGALAVASSNTGVQQCKRCPATRSVVLRPAKVQQPQPELVRIPTPDAPRSQWPAQ